MKGNFNYYYQEKVSLNKDGFSKTRVVKYSKNDLSQKGNIFLRVYEYIKCGVEIISMFFKK